MRLVRYGPVGQEKFGVVDQNDVIRDLPDDLYALTEPAAMQQLGAALARVDIESCAIIDAATRLGCPVANVGKIVCVGLNYRDHAEEAGMAIPEEPVLFMKATTAICGPNDDIILPPGCSKVDWEVELGIVIGKVARYVAEDAAFEHVAGYCIGHDVSDRAFQLERGGQWVKGKSFDTFAPLGPWLVSADEVPEPHKLGVWLDVNGKRKQDGNTNSMIFGVAAVISYVSHVMTLEPGDIILTGTPAGVALGQKKPVYLQPGDRVRLGIDGLGVQEQRVIDYTAAS